MKGSVVDDATRMPIPNAHVVALNEPQVSTLTDAAGAFRLEGIVANPVRVIAFVTDRRLLEDGQEAVGVAAGAEVNVGNINLVRRPDAEPTGFSGLTAVNRSGHIIVNGVNPDSPAAAAGLEVDDEIVSIDGAQAGVYGTNTVRYLLNGTPESVVALAVRHGQSQRNVALRRGPRP
jgi:predicted metalloprotease with PDZ domain